MPRGVVKRLPIDTRELRRLMGTASPEWYGSAFQRAYYRALRDGTATGRAIGFIADTLGIYPYEFVAEEVPA